MKARMNIRNIIMVMATISLVSMFFINICFAVDTGKISTETARLREKPQTDAKVLELASLGEKVEILEEVDGWYKVKYKNITGYLRKDLIEVEDKKETNNNNTEIKSEELNNAETDNKEIDNVITENTKIEENTTTVEETKIVKKEKYKMSEDVKLKIIPLISAVELNAVKKDEEVEVTEILNDWVKVKTIEGKDGWLRTEKLVLIPVTTTQNNQQDKTQEQQKVEEKTEVTTNDSKNKTKTMYVNSQTINVRQKADKTSQVIKQLSINTQVTVLSSDNGWAYVDVNGTKGYIAENLLSSTKQETSRSATTERSTTNTTNTTSTNTTTEIKSTENTTQTSNTSNATTSSPSTSENSSNTTGSSVVSYAKQFLGCKYVYGGTSTSGFDCSGFTQFVYKNFGVTLNRTASSQYSNGKAVTDLQAGDLVMFGKSGINHVGIYIGGNTFIHAANPSRGVTTDTLASGYYKTNYVGARRVF